MDTKKLSTLLKYSNNSLNIPALWYACLIGDKKAVEFLIQIGISPNNGALHRAIESGNVEIMEVLLRYGVKPDSGHLATAGEYNKCDAIRILFKYGADILDGEDPSSYDSKTAFECAAEKGNIEAMQLFLDHGFEINEVYAPWQEMIMTNIIDAHANGRLKMEIAIRTVGFLLDRDADINLGTYLGTPLVNAFNGPHSHLDLIALLIDRGAEVTPTIFVKALKCRTDRACIELLLSSGINILGAPILTLASSPDLKTLLIKHGAVNPITNDNPI